MDRRSDTELVRRAARGEEPAFAELVGRYREPLERLIGYQVNGSEAEDLLQETLLSAWRDLSRLRDPDKVKAWLLQVARNRCRDFLKRSGRREIPTEEESLELEANRLGWVPGQQAAAAEVVGEALARIPEPDRRLIMAYYLDGRSVLEIAAGDRIPEGSVKRRLHQARHRLRETIEGDRRTEMRTPGRTATKQPFPAKRPKITVKPSRAKPFAVDCRELRWWFGRPLVGETTVWAIYDPPDWKVSHVTELRGTQKARIHDLDGVEVEVNEWSADVGWEPGKWTMWGRLTGDAVQWLATARSRNDTREYRTFLDEGFEADWGGQEPRRLWDGGALEEGEDRDFVRTHAEPGAIGAGMFGVTIGSKRFTCLRVLDVAAEPDEGQTLVEAYLTKAGRTVLFRRYNGRLWGQQRGRQPWDEALPDHERIIVNDVTFVHWYDCLTGLAWGI